MALGVAVIKALQQLGISDCGLKWPNDILRQQRKLGGILVEISGETGGPCHAVIGLGLNFYLSQQQAEIITQPWTDISTALGTQAYSRRNELIALLLNQLMPLLADYSSAYIQQYVDEWRKFDAMLGKTVTIYIGEQTYQGMIMGINDEGLLILKTIDGQLRHFASGEVSFSQS